MEYSREGKYKFIFKIPEYKVKIYKTGSSAKLVDSVSISFPFGICLNIKPSSSDKNIARETVIKLVDRRILNSKECCGSCIKDSVCSLKEIKSDTIKIKEKLIDNINSPLFYLIDYIVLGINSFLNFMERYSDNIEENKEIYFIALEIIRTHIANCLIEISKIGNYKINNEIYAFKNQNKVWENDIYTGEGAKKIDIRV